MVLYQCPRCHYETCKKSHITTHYNRKRVCKTLFSRKSVKDCIEELSKKSVKDLVQELRDENTKRLELEQEVKNLKSEKLVKMKQNDLLLNELQSSDNQQEESYIDEFIYIIHPREFIKSRENIYKIGRTIKPKQRLSSYPKGSKVYLILPCLDSIEKEKQILELFNNEFIQRDDLGKEYFQGDVLEMSKLISTNCLFLL